MSSFIKIKLTFLDEFNFGQSSSAKTKHYLQVPFTFFEDHRVKMAGPVLAYSLLLLAKKSLSCLSDTLYCSKSDLLLHRKLPLSVALTTLEKLELIKIIDNTLPVYKRKEEKIREEKRVAKGVEEVSLAKAPAPRVTLDSKPTWEAYTEAFLSRWKTEPTRNQTTNSQMAAFLKRVPIDEAPDIARFYVFHNGSFYVQKQHPIGLLLQDAESLRTQWKTNRQVTRRDATHADNTQSTVNSFQIAYERMTNERKS